MPKNALQATEPDSDNPLQMDAVNALALGPLYASRGALVGAGAGNPLLQRVFHGTAQPGMTFEQGRPAHFTADPARASFYAESGMPRFVGDPKQPNVIPAYLNMRNPKVFENLGPSEHNAAFKQAIEAGHDGAILRTKGIPDTYVVFDPSQILPGLQPP